MAGQEIKCRVHSCKFNDKSMYCTLNDIVVGAQNPQARSKSETECVSFQPE